METGIGWLGAVIGIVGCLGLGAMVQARAVGAGDDEKRRGRFASGLAFVITVLFWAISMMRKAPFSPGQTMGFGFLIGGVLGSLAGLLALRLVTSGEASRERRLAQQSMMFFALFSVSLTYLIFSGNPHWALMGFAIGTVMSAILHAYVQNSTSNAGSLIENWAVFGVTIAAGILLAMGHFNQHALRMWWTIPILLAVTVLVAGYIGTEIGSIGRRGYALAASISILLVLGLSAIYAGKIVKSWDLLAVVAVGLIVAGIIACISSTIGCREEYADRLSASSISIFLLVAFVVAAFKLWSGLGIAMGLIAAWSVAILFPGSSEDNDSSMSSGLTGALTVGLVILLFRLFSGSYQHDLRFLDLQIHYTFIGALLGILFLFLALAQLMKHTSGDGRRLAVICAVGFVAASAPKLLYMIWEIKAVLGLLFGLSVGVMVLYILRMAINDRENVNGGHGVALLGIGSSLTAIAFIRPLMELDLTRATRIWVLVASVAVIVLWSIVTFVLSTRRPAGGR